MIARGSRRPLPPGALCFESSLSGLPGRLCLATFELVAGQLRCSAISEARLDAALEFVEDRVGRLARLQERTIAPFDLTRSGERATPREPPAGLSRRETDELKRELVNDHFRRWLDEPLTPLNGSTPREAVSNRRRDELELLLREIENHAERARRAGTAWPDLRWLREELGLAAADLAA